VDIFAAGIILFIMFAGSPPFSKAVPGDAYYKLIATGKNDVFWKFHAKHKGNPNFFSPEFRFNLYLFNNYFRDLLDGIFA
jgi:serine/threonine protein kinase